MPPRQSWRRQRVRCGSTPPVTRTAPTRDTALRGQPGVTNLAPTRQAPPGRAARPKQPHQGHHQRAAAATTATARAATTAPPSGVWGPKVRQAPTARASRMGLSPPGVVNACSDPIRLARQGFYPKPFTGRVNRWAGQASARIRVASLYRPRQTFNRRASPRHGKRLLHATTSAVWVRGRLAVGRYIFVRSEVCLSILRDVVMDAPARYLVHHVFHLF